MISPRAALLSTVSLAFVVAGCAPSGGHDHAGSTGLAANSLLTAAEPTLRIELDHVADRAPSAPALALLAGASRHDPGDVARRPTRRRRALAVDGGGLPSARIAAQHVDRRRAARDHEAVAHLTVGSLLGQPQGRPHGQLRGASGVQRPGGPPAPPPIARGQGCCKSGCFGCPWADAVRRRQAIDQLR
jgi:hypothetical protein